MLLRRWIARAARRRRFRQSDRKKAVQCLYAELFMLMQRIYNWPDCVAPSGFERTVRADMGEDMAATYRRVLEICESAAFSSRGVQEEDYLLVYNFVQKTYRLARRRLPLRKRWTL